MKKDELVNLIADHTDWKERVNASELADSILAALASQIKTQAYVHEHATKPHDHARFVSFDRSDVSKDFVCRALVYETADLAAAKARITALESERATLLHDVEIHAQEAIYAHAKVEAMEKGAEPVAIVTETHEFRGHPDLYTIMSKKPLRIKDQLYDIPLRQPDAIWIDVNDRLPANWGSYLVWDKHEGMRSAWFQLLDGGLDGRKAGLWYSDERRADSDEQDYGITHWMPLPEAPANQKQAW